MDQQTKDRLDGIDAKLDRLMEKLEQAESSLGAFLAGPGKGFAKVFKAIGGG
jgi:hypothetical protein